MSLLRWAAEFAQERRTDFRVVHAVTGADPMAKDAGLILIGRGSTQKPFGRLRSSAYSIIREAPCPVISM